MFVKYCCQVGVMQFLMQHQNKVIKNEGKIDRIEEYGIV